MGQPGPLLLLTAQPAADWEKLEAAAFEEYSPGHLRLRPCRRRLFLPRRQAHHLPGRGKRATIPSTRCSCRSWPPASSTASAPASARRPAATSPPTARRSSSPAAISIPTPRSTTPRKRNCAIEEKAAKKRRRYTWDFDPHMEIFEANLDGGDLKRLTNSPGYDAEGSYSPDGKQIVFCSNRSGKENLELYIMDADGGNVRQLTKAPGCYNGGPFFSPDGKRVIFRSDRKKKDHLQLYVINVDGTGETGLDRRSELGLLGPVLVQGQPAHHLHGGGSQQSDHGPAQLRSLLAQHRQRRQADALDVRSGRGRFAGVQPRLHKADVDVGLRGGNPIAAVIHGRFHAAMNGGGAAWSFAACGFGALFGLVGLTRGAGALGVGSKKISVEVLRRRKNARSESPPINQARIW